MKVILELLSAGLALLAASLWLRSALIKTPEKITMGYGGSGGSAQELGEAIRNQARWSSWAAYAAAASAVTQAASILMK